uniref:Ig-like domain-containing protein n=1 Tax=Naja naja TaxID=35670 RepID=A0A8C6Y242_NAJNA
SRLVEPTTPGAPFASGPLTESRASSHSLKYFCTAISDPSHGLPHFVALGYVDGQIFSYYDNVGQRMKPLVPWIEKAGQEDPQYWERNTRSFRARQELFRGHLENLKTLYNQSEGLHIWQLIYGCELQADGSKRGFYQFGYEGRTLITFNMETLTWVAPDPLAQFTQKKWDAIPELNQRTKAYLGEVCIEWLERYLSYGKETLLRTGEHLDPGWTFLFYGRISCDGTETHICRVDGFYPKEIDASWKRDGEVWEEETIHGFLAPNVDGTYHYCYQCHVEHDGLQEPLALALKGERLQGGEGWALWQAGRWLERNLAPDVSGTVLLGCTSKRQDASLALIFYCLSEEHVTFP